LPSDGIGARRLLGSVSAPVPTGVLSPPPSRIKRHKPPQGTNQAL